jgi:hypothetical protein
MDESGTIGGNAPTHALLTTGSSPGAMG